MKYETPEICVKLFELEDVVKTSGLGEVENLLTGGSGKGLKLDNKDNISESNLFSFNWDF